MRSLALALLAVSAACVQVLGIEDAQLDPLLQGSGGNGGGASSACTEYCDAVMSACEGPLAQYATVEVCLGVCAALPIGAPGDASGNTVGCRMGQALSAGSTGEPETHCAAAGPGGDGVCGSECDGYCALMQAVCPTELETAFDDLATCGKDCPSIPDTGSYDQSIRGGDSIECRLYHISAATLDDVHCSHAIGQSLCVAEGSGGGGGGS